MSITRLSGGLTPGDGADPRTFPAIWNATADSVEGTQGTVASQGSAIVALEGDVEDLQNGVIGGTAVYRFVDTVYFTSSGEFLKADYPWLRAIRVKCQAAGGGGGGAASDESTGGGGGGGGYTEKFFLVSALGASETVTCGAGGSGSAPGDNAGSAGGDSSFGSLLVATGGGGGNSSEGAFVNNNGGGASTPGDLLIPGAGGSGRSGGGSSPSGFAAGGSSFLGIAPPGRPLAASLNGTDVTAVGFGPGGAAGRRGPSGTNRPGAPGRDGIVIVELFA